MLIMEIKFKQLLFTAKKGTIRCKLEIANFWIEDYKRLPSSTLAIRSVIVVFVLICWKTSKKFPINVGTYKKAGLRQFFIKVPTP